MEKQAIIETEGLTKIYSQQVAVDHLSLSVMEGEVFGFLGPNGAGKTTTLASRFDRADEWKGPGP